MFALQGIGPEALGFGPWDWAVVLGLLVLTTWVGHKKAGPQGSGRDFFLGGRSLPWHVVAASIVATEISAVTFVSLPSVVWRDGGNLTYMQIGLFGSLIARAVVGYVLMPAYFEREIYSPYDYVGQRLGEPARRLTTLLFSLGGVLGQSARVYLTAVVLEVILLDELQAIGGWLGVSPLAAAVLCIGVVAVIWTWMGGLATVVWTDAILFLLFLAGAGVTLLVLHGKLEGGMGAALRDGLDAGKFRLIDTSTDLHKPYTLMVALLVASWGQIGPYGCDQLMVQRLLGCRDAGQARKAIVASIAAMGVTFLIAMIGIGLWAWTRQSPLQGQAAELVAELPGRIFPVFLRDAMPVGAKGLVVAGVFAAAISSLDSILAALSQTTLSLLPNGERSARRTVQLSRVLVAVYGLVLGAAAIGTAWVAERYDSILDLALAMAGYTGGALLAAVLLALLPGGRGGRGYVLSAPLSVLAVVAVAWHESWTPGVLGTAGVALAAIPLWRAARGRLLVRQVMMQLLLLAALLAVILWVAEHGSLPPSPGSDLAGSLPWPWYVPVGTLVAWLGAYGFDAGSAEAIRRS